MQRVLAFSAAVVVATVALSGTGSPAGAQTSSRTYPYPVAGDAKYLVYSQSHAPNGSAGYNGCSHGSPTLHVRTESGHTRSLAVPHTKSGNSYKYNVNPCAGPLQLTGHFLTLEKVFTKYETIYWWDLAKHTHGHRQLPQPYSKVYFLGNVDGGWLFADTNAKSHANRYTATTVYRQGTGGKVTSYAHLPRFSLFKVVTSTGGLVTGRQAEPLHYLPTGSSTPTKLGSPAHEYKVAACFGLTPAYAACYSDHENDSGKQYTFEVSITPLSGRPTISSTRAFDTDGGNYDVYDLVAAPKGVVGLVKHGPSTTLIAGFGANGRASSAAGHGARALVVAYGKIIIGHRGGKLTSQGSVTGAQHTLTLGH